MSILNNFFSTRRLTVRLLLVTLLLSFIAIWTTTAYMQQRSAPLQRSAQPVAEPAQRITKRELKGDAAKKQAKGEPEQEETLPEEALPDNFTPLAVSVASNYVFATATNASLTDMSTGTTQLLAANVDDTASPVTNIGFDFYFQGARFAQFSINENGVLRLGAGAQAGSPYKPLAQAGLSIITAYGADQRTHAGDGKVHFKVSGSAPNRVLVVEWLNNQADFNTGGTANLTYQVRLYETTGVIELVYGSLTMSAAGAADPNSKDPNIGFSSSNAAGTVGSVNAPQSGTPAPTFDGSSATPTANLYTAGAIPVLTSAAQGSRRIFSFTPPVPTAPTNLTFTGVTQVGTTLNWTDSPNETIYAIYRSTDNVNFVLDGTAAQNATSYSATGLTPNTNYFWRVFAVSEGALSTSLAGSQATLAAATIMSTAAGGNWSATTTWVGGVIPTAGDNAVIVNGSIVTIDTAANAYSLTVGQGASGILQYEATTARTLTVATDVIIAGGGTFQSAPTGTVTTHNLSLGGNLTNNGTLDFSTNADTAGAIITFTGATNSTFGGTGATTDIRQITVNKGTTNASVMELMPTSFSVRGLTTDTVVGGWLVMTNGTIKISGTFAGTSRVFAAAAYTIPATFGFWLNNPNYTVAAQAGNAINNGLLRLSQGTFNQGTLASHSFRAGTGAVFNIEGGTLNCAGQFSPQNAVSYTQSGGTLNVGTVGNSQSNFATFELFSASSTFNMSGGTINLVQASTGATQIDYQNLAVSTVTGGTLNVGTSATVTKFTFNLRGSVPNLVIDNTTNNKSATATALITLLGSTTIKPGTTLTINGQTCLILGPTFTNNGTLTGTAASTRFYFLGGLGATTYTGNGTVTAPLTAFEVDNTAGVTIAPTVNPIIVTRFNNFSGGVTGSGKLTLGNGGATTAVVQLGVTGVTQPVTGFDVPPVFNPGIGGVILLYAPELTGRTTGNEIPPSRTLATLGITNPNPITIAGGDVTVNGASAGALALGASRVITGVNTLYFNSAAGTVTRTTGYVDGNFKKSFAAAASKTFEVGTANGYSPATINATSGTFPADVTVKATQGQQPNVSGGNALQRFWTVTAPADLTADLTFQYLATDVVGTEASYLVYKYNGVFNNPAGSSVNTTTHQGSATGQTTITADWTLAEPASVPASTLQLSAATYSVSEAAGSINIPVKRTGNSTGAVGVTYATSDATATAGSDYTATSGTLSWADGDVTDKTINIPITDDSTYEGNETFNVTLSAPTGGAVLGTPSATTVTITDNDAAPAFSINDVAVSEPTSGTSIATFTITKTGATTLSASVDYSTQNGTATAPADYVAISTTVLSFAPGETTKTFNVTVNSDALTEGNETFFVNLSNAANATIADNQGQGTITDPVAAGQVLISEFRLRGALGANDEFVEFYNTTAAPLTVATSDGSNGWTLAASDNVARFTVPSGTVIPAHGHFLGANNNASGGYSLGLYPAGVGTTATPNATYTLDISDAAGIALFKTATQANFTQSNALDAVGFTSAAPPYAEGTALTSPGAIDGEYSFVRKPVLAAQDGQLTDSNNNATDFLFVSTTGAPVGGVPSTLGAPGAENLSSPLVKGNTQLMPSLIAPMAASSVSPNRVRDNRAAVQTPNSTSGTLSIQRRFTNPAGSGVTITRLRFRIIDITTLGSAGSGAGQADLRLLSSTGIVTDSGGATVATVMGTTLETPPAQANGGGLNSTLTVTMPGGGLTPGSFLEVQMLMGVNQAGSFRFFISQEALP
jgi:hypothetical protein